MSSLKIISCLILILTINSLIAAKNNIDKDNKDGIDFSKANQSSTQNDLKHINSDKPSDVLKHDEALKFRRGKEVYMQTCVICHKNGRMNAPVFGNAPNWYQRLTNNGIEGLYEHAIKGYKGMPYKGACVRCSDNDIIFAVDYILKQSLSPSQLKDIKTNKPNP